jgi:hypothetical protein
MKSSFFLFPLLVACLFIACNKNNLSPSSVAAFNIVNASIGSQGLVINFSDTIVPYFAASEYTVGFGSSALFSPLTGKRPLVLTDLTDTAIPILKTNYQLNPGGIYSLFISGSISAPDTIFSKDNIPLYGLTDSLTGVRFVNLSEGSNPLSIDIAGNPNMSVLNSLPYKNISVFQSFPANSTAAANGYAFEFRDGISDSLLVSYPLNIVINKNQTLAFYGNSAIGFNVLAIANY